MTSKQRPVEISPALIASVLPERGAGAHKWSVGGLMIVAGGPAYIGAAALSAMAAGRAGAGIVQLVTPRGAVGAIATLVPEVVFLPLRDGEAVPAARAAIEMMRPKLERSRAMLIGPGLGDDEHAQALIAAIFGFSSVARPTSVGFHRRSLDENESAQHGGILSVDRPTVIDADGLNWLAKTPEWSDRVERNSLILTPHAGEMGRLLDRAVDEILADPIQIAVDAAKKWGQTVVLKVGATVATDGEKVVVADDAPASLATAGSGDVFSGFIAGMLAQGASPLDAAAIAMFAGTRAARAIEERFGERGLVASDLPAAMAEAVASLTS